MPVLEKCLSQFWSAATGFAHAYFTCTIYIIHTHSHSFTCPYRYADGSDFPLLYLFTIASTITHPNTHVNFVYVIMLCHNFSFSVYHFLEAVLFNRAVDYEHLSAITYSFSIWCAWPFEIIFSKVTTTTTVETNAPFFLFPVNVSMYLRRFFVGEKNV